MSKRNRRYVPDPLNNLPARLAAQTEERVMKAAVATLNLLVHEDFDLNTDLAAALCTVAGALLMLNGRTEASLVSTAYNAKQYSAALFELLQTPRPIDPVEETNESKG